MRSALGHGSAAAVKEIVEWCEKSVSALRHLIVSILLIKKCSH